MKRYILIWMILPFLNLACYAQPINAAKLNAFFDGLSRQGLANGSIAISQKGKLQYQKAIGYSSLNPDHKIKTNTQTKYRVGSVSKLFTAVMIFQLIEEGKIKLNQPIDYFFPTVPNAAGITMGNLLNHRSGLHDYTKNTGFDNWMYGPKSHEEMVKLISEAKADFAPDTKTEYNNSNYLLLSYIIEQVDKRNYAEALQKRIVNKIGLTATEYGKPINPANNESVSYSYVEGQWKEEKQTDMSIHSGSGSLVSTPADLVKFVDALFSNRLVGKSSLQIMKTLTDGFGYGLQPWGFQSSLGFGKGGKIEGFLAEVYYFPEYQLTVAYCTDGYIFPVNDIIDNVLQICINKSHDSLHFEGIKLAQSELDQFIGTYQSAMMPITVTCTNKDGQLYLETKGQVFTATPLRSNLFMNKQYGYFFEFNPDKKGLVIKEKTNVYYLKKL